MPAERSARPATRVAAPRPVEPGPAPLGGASILAGRSLLGSPSILRSVPVDAPTGTLRPIGSAPQRHRRPWTDTLFAPPRLAGRVARSGGRAVANWSHRPSGRFVVPLMILLLVLAAAVTGGNLAVRAATPVARASASAAPAASASTPDDSIGLPPTDPDSSPIASSAGADQAGQPTHPQDVVAGWARRIAPAVGISETALKAYGYASLRVAADLPGCHLAWTTLAAIGKVESDHGTADHATLGPDGIVLPPIIGPALDGQGGRGLVTDTDTGRLDGDRVYDRAVGPMQFIPATWERYAIDADQDGQADPNDINDATLSAGRYLCAGGKDLATSGGWWGAIETYNELPQYAKDVFAAADDYGQRSRAVA